MTLVGRLIGHSCEWKASGEVISMAEEQVTRFTDFKSSGYQEPTSRSSRSHVPAKFTAVLALAAVITGAVYFSTQEVHSPDFLG